MVGGGMGAVARWAGAVRFASGSGGGGTGGAVLRVVAFPCGGGVGWGGGRRVPRGRCPPSQNRDRHAVAPAGCGAPGLGERVGRVATVGRSGGRRRPVAAAPGPPGTGRRDCDRHRPALCGSDIVSSTILRNPSVAGRAPGASLAPLAPPLEPGCDARRGAVADKPFAPTGARQVDGPSHRLVAHRWPEAHPLPPGTPTASPPGFASRHRTSGSVIIARTPSWTPQATKTDCPGPLRRVPNRTRRSPRRSRPGVRP